MEGFRGPARPSPTIAQCLNGGYANGAMWPGTIHGQAAWIPTLGGVERNGNTRLEHAPSIGSSNKRPQLPRLGLFLLSQDLGGQLPFWHFDAVRRPSTPSVGGLFNALGRQFSRHWHWGESKFG
jgi:hypothetical protein